MRKGWPSSIMLNSRAPQSYYSLHK